MNTLVRVQSKGQMTIPRKVRSAVGLADGDLVEVKAVGKKIVITPQLVIDRSQFPTGDDDYTPSQRRALDARLADSRKGRYYGPFKDGAEISAFLKSRRKASQTKPKKRGEVGRTRGPVAGPRE